jgi:glycosyltransferase involved in cell wall biosynthesis
LDHDDELSIDALYENVKLLNKHPEADLIYSDEDKIDIHGNRMEPFFKPDWSPQLLFSFMYIGHLSVYRKKLVEEVRGFRSAYDYSQDYDLALRITEKTNNIKHIQKVLYHWRSIPCSAAGGGKPYARGSNIAALKSALVRRGYDADVAEYHFANRVKFNCKKYPLVSIVIPTDSTKNILQCITLLLENTDYPNFEIIAITNSNLCNSILNKYKENKRVRCHIFDKSFNFSLKCNEGASVSRGEYILFLNDDIEVVENKWIEDMVAVFGKGNVGGVSPKLFYENNTIQFAGMVSGVRGLVGTAFHCKPKDSYEYFNLIQCERNVSLLSGACMLVPKNIFKEVGGFDAVNTPIMHSDIDLCFRIIERNYELIYTPFVALRHIGHLSLKDMDKKQNNYKKGNVDIYILKRWGDYLSNDPFYTQRMRQFLHHDGVHYYKLVANRQNKKYFSAKNMLFVTHDLSLSGAPLLLYYLACHFKKRGHFITVISPEDGELAGKYEKYNIPLIIDSTIGKNPFSETKQFMASFDHIIVNTLVMYASIFAAKETNVPIMWIIHESLFGLKLVENNKRMVKAMKIANDVLFIGKETFSLYEEYNTENNFSVVNFGMKALNINRNIKKEKGKLVILHIGSVEPRKGQDILIQSIVDLPKKYIENIKVYMVGRVLDNNFYRKVTKISKLHRNIHWVGSISREKVEEYMNKADIFVCTSRDEVGPLTVLEAMSCGKAIISTEVGGVPVMIENNKEGIIIDNEDHENLNRKIIYLYNNRNELERLGANALKKFYEKFNIEKFADNVLEMLGEKG